VTAATVAQRRQSVRERASADASASSELLALGAFVSVLSNEPA
jgi:hypothetical protein